MLFLYIILSLPAPISEQKSAQIGAPSSTVLRIVIVMWLNKFTKVALSKEKISEVLICGVILRNMAF
jgi:hypothetical protein